jgi:hypothetical protein
MGEIADLLKSLGFCGRTADVASADVCFEAAGAANLLRKRRRDFNLKLSSTPILCAAPRERIKLVGLEMG